MTTRSGISHQQLKMIWFAMVTSVLVYGILIFLVAPVDADDELILDTMTIVLAFAAVVMAISALVLPRLIAKSSVPESDGPEIPQPVSAFAVAPRLIPAFTVRYAMLEAVAILGLVLAFLQGDYRYFAPFAAVSLLGLFLAYPSEESVRSLDQTR